MLALTGVSTDSLFMSYVGFSTDVVSVGNNSKGFKNFLGGHGFLIASDIRRPSFKYTYGGVPS
jgi:hypothetical protein